MKKFLSLLLALTLALSLALPALALEYEDTDPPTWERWGYSSLEECLADMQMTEEEYAEEAAFYAASVLAEAEYPAWREAYLAAHPELRAAVVAQDDPPLWQQWDYESKAAFEADVCDEGESYEDWLLETELYGIFWDAFYENYYLAAEREALGLLDDLNVMLNGKPLSFRDALPELRSDVLMAPVQALMDALGASVTYDSATGAATVSRGDIRIVFTPGSASASVTRGEGTESAALACAPFLRDGALYIPVRFAAEHLGFTVDWSNAFRTAVVLDEAQFSREMDKNFQILNSVLGMGRELDLEQTYQGKSEMSLKLSGTLGDSEALTVGARIVADVTQNSEVVAGTVRYELDNVLALVKALSGNALPAAAEAALQPMLDAISQGLELVVDLKDGVIYMRGALLSMAFSPMQADLTPDTWFLLRLADLGVDPALLDVGAAPASVGELAAFLVSYMRGMNGTDPVYLQMMLDQISESLSIVRDSAFTVEGNRQTASIDLPALYAFAENPAPAGKLELAIETADGKAQRISGNLTYQIEEAGVSLACTFSETALEEQLHGTLRVGDLTVEFSLTGEAGPAPEAVLPALPPEGQTVDFARLLEAMTGLPLNGSLGVIGSADGPAAVYDGVIGSADGPTAVYVSTPEETAPAPEAPAGRTAPAADAAAPTVAVLNGYGGNTAVALVGEEASPTVIAVFVVNGNQFAVAVTDPV